MNFSVLISIYHKEKPEYFDRAMESIWDEQIVKPNEIVLVQDGKLTDELYLVINEWENKLGKTLKVISLKQNAGLGSALNEGIQHCSHDLIARMDTDDIAVPERFEKQLQAFQHNNIDVCGSWITEFEEDEEEKIISLRKVPQFHDQIIPFSKKRCPFNHVTVMYKKESVLSVGGYSSRFMQEDYYLWSKMILKKAKLHNIPKSLVKVRAGNQMLERRRGVKYSLDEINMEIVFFKSGFINQSQLFRNIVIRSSIRLFPLYVFKLFYKKLLRD